MLVHAGSSKAFSGETLDFDSVDRCFAAMAAAALVAFYRSRGVGVAQLGKSACKAGARFGRSWFQRRTGFSGETLRGGTIELLRSHPAAMEYEVRNIVALKRGVGDHTPERFADHEPRRNANHGGFPAFGPGEMDWKMVKRLNALT
jgi:hypothetical protein